MCHDHRLRSDASKKLMRHCGSKTTAIWSTDSLANDEVLLGLRIHDTENIQPIENFSISDWDPNAPEVKKAQERWEL